MQLNPIVCSEFPDEVSGDVIREYTSSSKNQHKRKLSPPKVTFEDLPNTTEQALFEFIQNHPWCASFLVYLRAKYKSQPEWTYMVECCSEEFPMNSILWLNDWYEGQDDVEYLSVAAVGA